MDWRLIWFNNSIVGYTNSEIEAKIVCEFNYGHRWTIPKKNHPNDYNKHKNKNELLKLINIDEIVV
jgi:hypothetical protein